MGGVLTEYVRGTVEVQGDRPESLLMIPDECRILNVDTASMGYLFHVKCLGFRIR